MYIERLSKKIKKGAKNMTAISTMQKNLNPNKHIKNI